MSVDELIVLISKGLSKQIAKEELLSENIKVSYLKRIDKIFNKGLHFYLDPKAPVVNPEASIFFRKHDFNADLNIGAKKIVTHFEEFKISLSAIAKLADLDDIRRFKIYSINDNPKIVANEIRQQLYPKFETDLKEFLKSLIAKFAEKNVLVFEFVEYWNQREKANIDGFFLNPNVIVIKRQQLSFRREIFTLVHELGHFLLNIEEIEKIEYQTLASENLSSVERWCNDFAYHFLIGEYSSVIESLDSASVHNDYNFEIIEQISMRTHLSKIALYTRLLYQNKISQLNYNKIKDDFEQQFAAKKEEQNKLRQLDKQNGVNQKGSAPQPIKSPLLISTIQTAFYEGVINEYEVCKTLNIKPENIEKYIQ